MYVLLWFNRNVLYLKIELFWIYIIFFGKLFEYDFILNGIWICMCVCLVLVVMVIDDWIFGYVLL